MVADASSESEGSLSNTGEVSTEFNATNWSHVRTAMVQHIPKKCKRVDLVAHLQPFMGEIDFLYLPFDFSRAVNLGYAFINFRTSEGISRFVKQFHGADPFNFCDLYGSSRRLKVSPARVQGLQANLERVRGDTGRKGIASLHDKPNWQPLFFDEQGNDYPFPWLMNNAKFLDCKKPHDHKAKSEAPTVPNDDHALECAVDASIHTTLVIRGIPANFSRDALFDCMQKWFPGSIDFFYLPIKCGYELFKKTNVGYCFINFSSHVAVKQCITKFHRIHSADRFPSSKNNAICTVSPARIQGLEASISSLQETIVTLTKLGLDEWLPLGNNPCPEDSLGVYMRELPFVDPSHGVYTTIMVRNVPKIYHPCHLVSRLKTMALLRDVDFLFLPPSRKDANRGVAFLNFKSTQAVKHAVLTLNNRVIDGNLLKVSPSLIQGVEANLRHLSCVLSVEQLNDEDWGPMVLDAGSHSGKPTTPRDTSEGVWEV